MKADLTSLPMYFSATSFILVNIMAVISSRGEVLGFTLVLDLSKRLVEILLNDIVEEVLDIGRDKRIGETATDQTLDVEDGIDRVNGDLILGCVPSQTFIRVS